MKLIKYLLTLLLTGTALGSFAQLNPFQSMYYQNRYLLNPAMAGLNNGLSLNLDYLQQFNSFPGTPKTAIMTADYTATDKVGIGLNISDDQAGILRSTQALGSYAYHLPIGDQQQLLNFGLSLGINNSRVDYSKVNGDLTDDQIAIYNQLKPYVEGSVGIAYTSDTWLLSGALPSLNNTLFHTSDNRFDMVQFMAAAAYKFSLPTETVYLTLEPMTAYRVVKGNGGIVDAGLNFGIKNYGLNFQAMYHSNQNMSAGFGLNLQSLQFMFNYNLQTGSLSNYTNGAFELGMRLYFAKK